MDWQPPSNWRRLTTIESHTEGEPLRLVTSGIDPIPGSTIIEKRRYAIDHYDELRRTLVYEPRGHADMYGAIITEPVTKDGDVGVLFLNNEGWSTMCGHGIIAVSTILIETRMLSARETVKIDAPPGRITAHCRLSKNSNNENRVTSVAFENVASFVSATDQNVDVPGIGCVRYDIAYGGAFYAFVEARDYGLELTPSNYNRLIEYGMSIKHAVMKSQTIRHPFEPDLSFLYGTIFVGPSQSKDADSRHVCIFADGQVDRSPTGTGVSARLALEHARGRIKTDEKLVVESILGTRFTGRVKSASKFGGYVAVIPEVEGRAWIVGRSEFLIVPDDPLKNGFILR
jgi:trans-L-3-hydroxyproline dehydratase